jgi:hypothetical protein
MVGDLMNDVRQLVFEAVMDDWVSDYEVQGDFQAELGLETPEAYQRMVIEVADWIRSGALVAGDMLDGFVPWDGSGEEIAARFLDLSAHFGQLTRPGQICWFDSGPDLSAEPHSPGRP